MKELILDTSEVDFSAKDRIKGITLPTVLTEELAYDIGVHIADGSMGIYRYSYGTDYIYKCCGNSQTEKEWYDEILIPLKIKLFNIPLKSRVFNDGSYGYQFRSKAAIEFYHKVMDLPLGKKCEIIKIPELILNCGNDFKLACLRGIFDADGYLSFKRRYRKVHYYPYIGICTKSEVLHKQIKKIFDESGVHSTGCFTRNWDKRFNRYGESYNNHISGKKYFEAFRNIVGFRVKNDITKIQTWEKFGYCPPYLNVGERLEILNGKVNPLSYYDGTGRI